MPERAPFASRVSLVGILAGVLFCELWLNRVLARMVRLDPAASFAGVGRRLDTLAAFVFELASVLGAMLLVGALARIVGSARYRGPSRFSFALVGSVAAVLAAAGVLTRLPPRFMAHLYMSAGFLLVVLVLAVISTSSSRRLRAGIVLLAAPVAVMLVANLMQRFTALGVLDPRASALADLAGAGLVAAGLASPWLLRPVGAGGPLAVAMALAVGATGLALGVFDWDGAAQLAGLGLGVSVPIGHVGLPIYTLGACAYAYTIGALLVRPGVDRLRGVGLLLVGTVGVQLELPYQIAGSLVGFLCLLDVANTPDPRAITRAQLDDALRRWAALVGATQVTVVGTPGRERARIAFSTLDGSPATFLLDRRADAIARFELSIGEVPDRAPPVTLSARGARSLGPSAPGPIVATGDATFDARYTVRDHRGAGTAMLDGEARERIMRLAHGWLGVWPQRGARFCGLAVPDGDDGLPSLAQLLCDLRERAGS